MFVEDSPFLLDGRRRRSQQSRDRIVAAMMSLVEDGQIHPIAEQVAERAQVGLRSVFRHFKDMDSLFFEMTMRLTQAYQPALAPFASAEWRDQLDELMGRRFDIYEKMLPYKTAADAHRHMSVIIQSNYAEISQLLRLRLRAILPPALQDDPIVFEALDLLLSIDSWRRLRHDQRLSPETSRAVIEAQVRLLIA